MLYVKYIKGDEVETLVGQVKERKGLTCSMLRDLVDRMVDSRVKKGLIAKDIYYVIVQ